MPVSFLDSVSGKLSEKWVSTLFTPAFLFWMLGFLSLALNRNWTWETLENWWQSPKSITHYVLIFSGLLVVLVSSFIVQWLTLGIIQFLEGYWPKWMNPLRKQLIRRQEILFHRKEKRWQSLAFKQEQNQLSRQESEEYVQLDWQLRKFPSYAGRIMPTKLGNLLRAAEEQPLLKYGLDAVICWPRLWLVLPGEVKQELQEARSNLNSATRVWFWSVLLLIWLIFQAWWIVPVSLLSAYFSYQWILSAAETYGDLLESAFDLHRFSLYRSFRWPLPNSPEEERQLGQQITEYLWRGSCPPQMRFEELKSTDHL